MSGYPPAAHARESAAGERVIPQPAAGQLDTAQWAVGDGARPRREGRVGGRWQVGEELPVVPLQQQEEILPPGPGPIPRTRRDTT